MTLHLEAKGQEQTLVKEYLEQNASESLAAKIDDGVWIEKDGKRLLNKKTLDGFFRYATEEARKQADKGASSACIHSDVVFGWAIHYFEEDSIIGVLYNEDGTPYKVAKATPTKAKTEPLPREIPKAKPQAKPQMSFFDAFNAPEGTDNVENEEDPDDVEAETVEGIIEAAATVTEEMPKEEATPLSPLFVRYFSYVEKYPNEIIAMRVGDFYEVFGLYAKQVAEVAELTIVGRDVGLADRMEMVGFPYHTKEIYIEKIRQKYPVTVVEADGSASSYPVLLPTFKVDIETGEVLEEPTHDTALVAIIKNILGEEIEVI